MKTIPHKTERIHSLDSLSAIMMMLGLVLHSSNTYAVFDFGNAWLLKDTGATHLSNDFISFFIHTFRMPIFFVVAGFFGPLLFYERKPLKMIKNRVSRIVFPFIVFLLILNPLIIFSFVYTDLIFSGNNTAFETTLSYFSNPLIFIPQITYHLWFLYYLALITFASVGLGLVFKKLIIVSSRISLAFNWVIQKPVLRILVFAGLTSIVYFFIGTSEVETSTSLIPDLNTFIFYFFFYIIGWILFKSKHLLDSIMRLDWICTILGLVLFSIHFFMYSSFTFEMHIIAKSVIVWLLIFGITGLFIRYGSNHSSTMRYISIHHIGFI